MREYELTVIYNLSVTETGGPDAATELLTSAVEARGGKVLRSDHWGRRRMAYPIENALDGDYIVARIEVDPAEVSQLETNLRIDERVYRYLAVRADELPTPPPPREPRRQPGEAAPEAQPAVAGATPAVAESPASSAAPAEAPAAAPAAEAPAAEAPAQTPSAPAAETDANA